MTSLEERERRVIAANGKVRFFPLSVTRGEGSFLFTEDGRRLLDLSGSWGAASLGYGHLAVADAVAEAARTMPSMTNVSNVNPQAVALAEELLALLPGDGDRRVWLGHCGSDANDAVARAITAATGRSRFVSFIGGAHGGSTGALALSGYSALQLGTVPAARPGHVHAPYPDPYRPPFAGDVVGQCLGYFRYLLDTIAPPEQIGGVFVEAIMCDAGDVVPPPGFLSGLAEICHERGIFLICDEVKVGLGRTGLLHAFGIENIEPDFVTFGKGLGGGLPIGAAVGPAEVMDNAYGLTVTTLAGNPVAAAAARTVLRIIAEQDLVRNAEARGRQLLAGLQRLATRHRSVGEVRGRGLVAGIDLVTDHDRRTPAPRLAAKATFAAAWSGAVLFYVGHGSNVLELTPPLTISEAEIALGLEILDAAIGDAEAGRITDAMLDAYAGW